MPPRTLDQLGDEIAELSVHLDAATARLLDLIREFDTRAGWNNGFRSCAYVARLARRPRPGRGPRARPRGARARRSCRSWRQALARGELSYAKVRALTRVATPETEERLLAVGRAGTAEHVERIVRGLAARGPSGRGPRDRALATRAERYMCIKTQTARWWSAGGWSPRPARCCMQALTAAREALYKRAQMRRSHAGGRSRGNADRSLSSRLMRWR